ncbi:MAG TPA: hypothetical protein VHL59_08200, partial [Thermoanaerobaculia bacterium]|nr:hypothetical protein [Thermoanaerobaculia bacterium]
MRSLVLAVFLLASLHLHAAASVRLYGEELARFLQNDGTDNTRIVVTTPSDFGAGSLRAAIEAVNDDPLCGTATKCTIVFAGPMTIAPSIPLPPIRKCNVEIVGGSGIEPPNEPKPIVISGENATWGNGLEVRASCAAGVGGVTIQSLVVHWWPWNGIYFEAPAPHAGFASHGIYASYIGLDP